MIELILQVTLFINGFLLSRVGVVYIQSPQKEILHQWGYKNEVFTETNINILDIVGKLFQYNRNQSGIFCKIFIFTLLNCKITKRKINHMIFCSEIRDKKTQFFCHTEKICLLVPLYGISLFTIGIFNLAAVFLFGIRESSYVLLISGTCFWFGTNFVRSSFPKKTSNYYIKGRKEVLNSLGYCFGFVCLLVGILGFTYA